VEIAGGGDDHWMLDDRFKRGGHAGRAGAEVELA
jgi:hypothetical protein